MRKLLLCSFLFALALGASAPVVFDCTQTEFGLVALNDLGADEFALGHLGGLYPGGQNTRPSAHLAAGLAIAENEVVPSIPVTPGDPASACTGPDASGRIGLISIGMCNTSQEFDAFLDRLTRAIDDQVVIVNGAQGGMPASDWADALPTEDPWLELSDRVADAGLHPCQVQVAWIKQAERQPGASLGPFPTHAEALRDDLEVIVGRLVEIYPNLRLCFLSSRTRAYTEVFNSLNPEPFAYESGFSVRWLIERQLAGLLPFALPGNVAPWLSWGPYLWTDGEAGRSDGFVWLCSDLEGDFTHPASTGEDKVADQLNAFFLTDATTRPWFLEDQPASTPPTLAVTASTVFGPAPLTVEFEALALDPDGGAIEEYAWTFGDGGFAYGAGLDAPTAASVQKTFPAPGRYPVTVTVTDQDGAWATSTTEIHVTPPFTAALEPEADAFVRGGATADQNFGLAPVLTVALGGSAASFLTHLRFDITDVPATSGRVSLILESTQLLGSGGLTVSAYSVADDGWSETGVTWNNQPAAVAELDARYVTHSGVAYRFDVTEFVRAERAAGDAKASFVLLVETPDVVQVQFSSREGMVAPRLEYAHEKIHVRRR